MKFSIAVLGLAFSVAVSSGASAQSESLPAPQPTPQMKEVYPMQAADYTAAKKQIEAGKKLALAACRKLKAEERSACRKDAATNARMSMADLDARK